MLYIVRHGLVTGLLLVTVVKSASLPWNTAGRSMGKLTPYMQQSSQIRMARSPTVGLTNPRSDRNMYRRHSYNEPVSGMHYGPNNYETDVPYGSYQPPQRSRGGYGNPYTREQSHLPVVTRGMEDDLTARRLQTKTLEGFDLEDEKIILEEEMNDPLTYVNPRYHNEPLMPPVNNYRSDITPPRSQWSRNDEYCRRPIAEPEDLEPHYNSFSQRNPGHNHHVQPKGYKSQYYQQPSHYNPPATRDYDSMHSRRYEYPSQQYMMDPPSYDTEQMYSHSHSPEMVRRMHLPPTPRPMKITDKVHTVVLDDVRMGSDEGDSMGTIENDLELDNRDDIVMKIPLQRDDSKESKEIKSEIGKSVMGKDADVENGSSDEHSVEVTTVSPENSHEESSMKEEVNTDEVVDSSVGE